PGDEVAGGHSSSARLPQPPRIAASAFARAAFGVTGRRDAPCHRPSPVVPVPCNRNHLVVAGSRRYGPGRETHFQRQRAACGDWPEFGELLGARYDGHPWNTAYGSIINEDPT